MEYFGIGAGLDDVRQVLAVGVSNKDLAELFSLYHRDNALHTLVIQTVEDIIQQQDGLPLYFVLCHFVL